MKTSTNNTSRIAISMLIDSQDDEPTTQPHHLHEQHSSTAMKKRESGMDDTHASEDLMSSIYCLTSRFSREKINRLQHSVSDEERDDIWTGSKTKSYEIFDNKVCSCCSYCSLCCYSCCGCSCCCCCCEIYFNQF